MSGRPMRIRRRDTEWRREQTVFVNGEENKCNTTRIKENFYGRPGTL